MVVNDVDRAEAEKVVAEIKAKGGRARREQRRHRLAQGRAGAGRRSASTSSARIHFAVNNAGIVRDRSFLKMTDEDWELVLRIHAGGTFWCAQEAALRMKDQGTGGAIVNTVSAAHMGNFGQTNYGGAKGAIASMTYTWANELSRYGIRVNAISPAAHDAHVGHARRAPTARWSTRRSSTRTSTARSSRTCAATRASWITGQVFGSGSDRVVILEQPTLRHRACSSRAAGAWRTLREHMPKFFKGRLEPVGLFKKPYPYYDGVKPQAE